MDPLGVLTRRVAAMSLSDISPDALSSAKRLMAESLAVAAAGLEADGLKAAMSLATRWGRAGEATIWSTDASASPPLAALVNAVMLHARDFDDSHDAVGVHCMVATLPPALAVAQAEEQLSGARLLTAVVAAIEMGIRVGEVVPLDRGWHYTSVLGTMMAATAAGKMMHLETDRLQHAIGLAYCRAAGNRQGRKEAALSKRYQPGFAAQAGVECAYLAAGGVTGPLQVIEGPWGLRSLYGDPRHEPPPRVIRECLSSMGRRFCITELSSKPYPCCRQAHGSIDAVLRLRRDHDLDPRQITSVEISAPEKVVETVGRPYSAASTRELDGQFSVPYLVAVAIYNGGVSLEDFHVESLGRAHVIELARRVRMRVDYDLSSRASLPIEVIVTMRSGDQVSCRIAQVSGSPHQPLTDEQWRLKLSDCWRFAGRNSGDLESLINLVNRLDEPGALTGLLSLLSWCSDDEIHT